MSDEETVYIGRNNNAVVYHTATDCGNAPESPRPVSKAEAERKGRRVCWSCVLQGVSVLDEHDRSEREAIRAHAARVLSEGRR